MSDFPQYYDDPHVPAKTTDVRKHWLGPMTALMARVVTAVSLVVAIMVFRANRATLDDGFVLTYKFFSSSKYALYIAVIGAIYTMLQIPFAMWYAWRKKRIVDSDVILMIDFYADKVVAFLLASATGVAFGAIIELRDKVTWKFSDSKVQSFLTLTYIPATFLLLACLASIASSILSSLALSSRMS